MSIYTEKQFIEDVKAEATALKEMATKEELKNLEDGILDPFDYQQCIYGLLTGDCYSPRAAELIFGCCPRYFVTELNGREVISREEKHSISNAIQFVNGTKIPDVENAESLHEHREEVDGHFSSIEVYIGTKDAKTDNLLAFLKDETQTLEL